MGIIGEYVTAYDENIAFLLSEYGCYGLGVMDSRTPLTVRRLLRLMWYMNKFKETELNWTQIRHSYGEGDPTSDESGELYLCWYDDENRTYNYNLTYMMALYCITDDDEIFSNAMSVLGPESRVCSAVNFYLSDPNCEKIWNRATLNCKYGAIDKFTNYVSTIQSGRHECLASSVFYLFKPYNLKNLDVSLVKCLTSLKIDVDDAAKVICNVLNSD